MKGISSIIEGLTTNRNFVNEGSYSDPSKAVKALIDFCSNRENKVFNKENSNRVYKEVEKLLDSIKPGTIIETRGVGKGERKYLRRDNGNWDVYEYEKVNKKYIDVLKLENKSSSYISADIAMDSMIYPYDKNTKIEESIGYGDIVTVVSSGMAREIEKSFIKKYERALETVGSGVDFDVYVRDIDDRELGISNILDNISVNIYFEDTKVDSKTALNKIKQIFKKYSFADFRYSKKDDSYFIETFGQDDSFDFIETLASDGINVKRFYDTISSSQIEADRDEDEYEDREYKRMLRNLPR